MLAIRKYIKTRTKKEANRKSPKLQITMEDFRKAIQRVNEHRKDQE